MFLPLCPFLLTCPRLFAVPVCSPCSPYRNTPSFPGESGLTSPRFHHQLHKPLPHSPQPESHISPKSASSTRAARKMRTMSRSPFVGCPRTCQHEGPDACNFPSSAASARSKRPPNHSPEGGAKLSPCCSRQASLGLSPKLYHGPVLGKLNKGN